MKTLRLIIVLFAWISGALHAQHVWDGTVDKTLTEGNGSQESPYLISTPEQLAGLAALVNADRIDFAGKHFRLTQDIYLNSFAEGSDTLKWEPIGHIDYSWTTNDTCAFRGSFDGAGHTIFNIYNSGGIGWGDDYDPWAWDSDITSLDLSVFYKALFGVVDGGTIENVRMAGGKMSALGQALLAVSVQEGTTIRNCHVEGSLRSSSEGLEMAGLVYDNHGLIENCTANITAFGYDAAPIAVYNREKGIIRNCVAEGEVNITCHAVGSGFVCNNEGLIESCETRTNISARLGNNPGRKNALSAAGFVDTNSGLIRECATHGNLSTDITPISAIDVGVVAGFCMNNYGRIESSYSDGVYTDNSSGEYAARMVMFVHNNGATANNTYEIPKSGSIANCFAAGSIEPYPQPKVITWEQNTYVFHYDFFTEDGGSNYDMAEPSQETNCYWRTDGIPFTDNPLGCDNRCSGHGITLEQMQSRAFVDTLNRVAKLLGISQWEYRPGQLPYPTGIRVKDVDATEYFAGGDGTKDNPYLIASKEDLLNVAWLANHGYDFRNEYLRQTTDIELNEPRERWSETMPVQWEPIGATKTHSRCNGVWTNYFMGNYDGAFHEVRNLYIDNLSVHQGLFGNISRRYNSVIRNLGVTGAYVHASSGGILAGFIGGKAHIIQCHLSGEAMHEGNQIGNIGSFASDKGANVMLLNCSSSALVNGNGAFFGNDWSSYESQIVNAIYTGESNVKGPDLAFELKENCFVDGDKSAGGDTWRRKTTTWLQSADCVNTLNDAVSRWNDSHADDSDLQLNYWQLQEGDYPKVSENITFRPAVSVSFINNGGTELPTRYVVHGSLIVVPTRPTKEGQLFAGWYKDEQLTDFFDFENERPTSSLTLYAKWIKNDICDYDLSPFANKFATTFHIKTAAQLRAFAAIVNGIYDAEGNLTSAPNDMEGKTVVLDNDIFLNDTTDWQFWGHNAYAVPWEPIGHIATGIGRETSVFKGTFDGQGHVVYGMYIEMGAVPMTSDTSLSGYGLFGRMSAGGCVLRNVGIKASVIDLQLHDGLYYYGYVGIGANSGLLASDLQGEGNIVEQCFAEGKIIVPFKSEKVSSWNGYVAGLIGQASDKNNTIVNCYARVNIENPENQSPKRDAGLVNVLSENCSVSNCYSAGNTYMGLGTKASAVNSYYNRELVSDETDSGAKFTTEMKAKATYTVWDFENIWGRNDDINNGYPYLRQFYLDAPEDSDDPAIVTGIVMEEADSTLTIYVGDSLQLHARVLPENALNQKILWTITPNIIGGTPVLTVNENGLVKAERAGNTIYTVTATSQWGEYKTQCYISTKTKQYATSISIAKDYPSSLTISDTHQFTATVYPADAVNRNVVWSSSNENVIAISPEGLATAVGIGTATVYAKAEDQTNVENGTVQADRLTALVVIQVLPIYVTSMQWLTDPATTMIVGDEQQLAVICLPDNATDKTITWTSSNTNVLTIGQDGLVTAVGKGTATVTASANLSNIFSKLTTNITVKYAEPESIVINEGDIEMSIGEERQLSVTILPENADPTVTWKCNCMARYMSISNDGLLTMKMTPPEPVIVTATTSNGLQSQITVTYKAPDAINNLSSEDNDEEWCTIDGRRLLLRPTKPGLYILNGRKIMIR